MTVRASRVPEARRRADSDLDILESRQGRGRDAGRLLTGGWQGFVEAAPAAKALRDV